MADIRVKISQEMANLLDTHKDENTSRAEFASMMIDKGINCASTIELDNVEKQEFFKHLSGGKGKEYQIDLMSLELTEQELIDLAIEKSGKRYEDLIKEALITHCKEQITQSARRAHKDETTDGSPEKRLQIAFAELIDLMNTGGYRPRGGRLNISAVSQRARVNYNTARKWAEDNQPELLN